MTSLVPQNLNSVQTLQLLQVLSDYFSLPNSEAARVMVRAACVIFMLSSHVLSYLIDLVGFIELVSSEKLIQVVDVPSCVLSGLLALYKIILIMLLIKKDVFAVLLADSF